MKKRPTSRLRSTEQAGGSQLMVEGGIMETEKMLQQNEYCI